MELKKILSKLGIESLNEMQQQAIKTIQGSDDDVVILSPTGSGKTFAYLLPLIQKIDSAFDEVQAVVIVPGRELALQSQTVLKDMGSGLRSMALYGGRATMDEHRQMRDVQPQIVFATPGRLNDHLAKRNITATFIKYVVIDEFDKCLEMGFRDEMSSILQKLRRVRQHILLSATDAPEIPNFVRMSRTKRINFLKEDDQVPARVTIYQVHSPSKDKLETLSALLRTVGDESSVVFLNYRDSVERTASFLKENGFTVSAFHGGLEQQEREDALYKFSNGSANILVCTDLASRGLDIPDIRHIIHYQLPLGEDGYVHRVGRTARWDATGNTYFILGPEENIPEYVDGEPADYQLPPVEQLPPPVPPRMVTLYIGKGKQDKISKGDIVGFLCKIGGASKEDIGRIDVKERYAYVAIRKEMVKQVLRQTNGERIKKVKTVVEIVK